MLSFQQSFAAIAAATAAISHIDAAIAQPVNDEAEIVVVASTREYKATAKELRAAQSAFAKFKPRYSPNAQLRFEIEPVVAGETLDGLQLSLLHADERVGIAIDERRRFQLPAIDGDDWRLVANRSQKLRLRAWVVSPGSDLPDWRLGDLALQCRVGWAIARQSASVATAGLFGLAGGCASSRIAFYQDLGRPIEQAVISEKGRQTPVPRAGSSNLRLPTYLKGYSNEARVRVRFRL